MSLARATPPASLINPESVQTLSDPGFGSMSDGVSAKRQARGRRSRSAATGRKIRGHLRKTFPSRTSPPQSASLPETSRHTAGHGARKASRNTDKKKAPKRIIFIASDQLSPGTLSILKRPKRRWRSPFLLDE